MSRLESSPELIVFDLDGTLIDSLGDIASAVNRFRNSRGGDSLTEETVRQAVGHGARKLCQQLLSDLAQDKETPEDLYQAFRKIYITEAGLPDHQLRWLPGTLDVFTTMRQLEIPGAILTNKPRKVTDVLQPRLLEAFPWSQIYCPEDCIAPKPDPAGLQQLIELHNTTAKRVLFVGDSAVDFSTGKAAGVFTLGLRGGYGQITPPEPDGWLEDMSELVPVLNNSHRKDR